MKRAFVFLVFLSFVFAVDSELLGQEPDLDPLLAFAREPLRFDSFCFCGETFPRCEFDNPRRVERLVGPYKLTAPKKEAGRYAAVVEIARPGRVSERFFTLYHLAGNPKQSLGAAGATLTLPKGTGIDPTIVRSQNDDVDGFVTQTALDALRREPAGAALLAGLLDLTQLKKAGKAADDDRGSYRERQWWVDFRRKYYGIDKLYPKRFECPQIVKCNPAPMVRDGSLAAAGMKPGAKLAIDEACQTWARENGIGFSMCVVRRGVVIINKGYGTFQGKAVTAETPGILAS
jgi:hypothetical protein